MWPESRIGELAESEIFGDYQHFAPDGQEILDTLSKL